MKLPKNIFEHTFPNGTRIEISNRGFCLWDEVVGRWVIDGSVLADDNLISISNHVRKLESGTYGYEDISATYPEEDRQQAIKWRA